MEPALTTRADPHGPDAGGDLAALIERASRGDERAWEDLVGLYAGRVYAMAQSRVRRPDLAEEITQSVFVTVAITLKERRYDEQGRFEPWLFRVTMNRVRDAARRMRRHAAPVDPGTLEASTFAADPAAPFDPDEAATLRRALAALNEADREVIELRHHGRMNFKDIAAVLGEPVGTVLARHHRALRKLRDLIGPAGPGDEPA